MVLGCDLSLTLNYCPGLAGVLFVGCCPMHRKVPGLIAGQGHEEESAPFFSPNFSWSAGHLWGSLVCRCITPVSACVFVHLLPVRMSVCPNLPFAKGSGSPGVRATLLSCDLS